MSINEEAKILEAAGFKPEHARLHVCGRCHELYEPNHPVVTGGDPREERGPQRCRCSKREEATWPAFDFNEMATLCYCCVRHVIPSGSRWSQFFCPECRARVMSFNKRMGFALIPIGRHSMMAGIGLPGPVALRSSDPEDEEANAQMDGFVRGSISLFERIDLLGEWKRTDRMTLALGRIGLAEVRSVPLEDYLVLMARIDDADQDLMHADAFRALRERFLAL